MCVGGFPQLSCVCSKPLCESSFSKKRIHILKLCSARACVCVSVSVLQYVLIMRRWMLGSL